ncbi:threonyl-tRNA synthetase [Dimargaris xerosporica]|nr:threonyl-tRNA synthetase [Dimargaris xerosporica]
MADLENQLKDLKVTDAKPKPKAKAKKSPKGDEDSAYPLEISPRPEYLDYRARMFEELKAKYDAFIAKQPREPITVTLPDGSQKMGTSFETTPMAIAREISKSLAERLVIAKVDGELFDSVRPLEKSCRLELLDFEHPEGKKVFWHSSAHVLGESSELHYGCHLCIGPPIDEGFYYEMGMTDANRSVSQSDYAPLETLAKRVIKEKQPFERLEMSKADLLTMFKHNPYKVHLINNKIPDGTSTTVYRCGSLIDLCRGPHIPHTGRIKSFAVLKNSSSYFLGDASNATLQRLYGISFPDNKQMTEYKKFLEEAAKRDHRKIGKDQELFFFHELSPGSCFFLPHGTRIYNKLVDMIKHQYRQRGFEEVVTPTMFNCKLWMTSGHWENYKDDMFTLPVDKEEFALKPMNCPGHCVMFGHRERSYRELPLRYADFGVLHRNEASGALSGLTRVRRFSQDDAHIFCRPDQVKSEMQGCLDFLQNVYGVFGFKFFLELSTRPDKHLGDIETWNEAEKQLEEALNAFGHPWELNPGDGAFYGPKIDITIADALNRKHRCATIQLDFQLPERFKLAYRSAEGGSSSGGQTADAETNQTFKRPVIVHRAILGSVERMMAILTEHFAGKWPFWLNPRQVMVVPVTGVIFEYAREVRQALHHAGLYADVDLSDSTLNKKIRNAEIAQYNFVVVVGAEEQSTVSVNVRNRDDVGTKAKGQTIPLADFVNRLVALDQSRALTNQF